MPDFSWIWWWVTYFKLNFAKTIWWWQLEWREEWIPDSITMFGWDVKIRSIREEEFGNICVGSLIIWSNLSCEVTFSVVYLQNLFCLYYTNLLNLALKSPIAVNRKWFFCARNSSVISKISEKVSKSF